MEVSIGVILFLLFTVPLHNTCEGRNRTCPLVYRSPDHSESKHHPEILHLNAGARWNSVDVSIRDAVVLCVEKKDSTFRNKWIFGCTETQA